MAIFQMTGYYQSDISDCRFILSGETAKEVIITAGRKRFLSVFL
jgi:hypothetical protein